MISVFPAYAGMFRPRRLRPTLGACFPRIRGDVPSGCLVAPQGGGFSPHTRGCSCASVGFEKPTSVFPAYAGMFLASHAVMIQSFGFPRIRGDVPFLLPDLIMAKAFSPHTRGCSGHPMPTPISAQVFPAYAGMFRIVWKARLMLVSFPRIRGDVPLSPSLAQVCVRFSPHTRGCSYCRSWRYRGGRVFPAYAGMFRNALPDFGHQPSFPRIRGDVPG